MKQKRTRTTPRTRLKRVAKNTLVPHRGNQYRPHLIRGHGLAVMIALVVAVQLGYNFMQTRSVLGQKTDVTRVQLLADTNKQRRAVGEQDLRLNDKLNLAAQEKAQDMFKEQYWAHVSPSGLTPWHWFKEAGYDYAEAGENLAEGFHSSAGVLAAWMNSKDHRQNILDTSYEEVGFAVKTGVLNGRTTTLVVALYGQPAREGGALLASTQQTVLAAKDTTLSPIARLGIGVQSMTPALVGSLVLIGIVIAVALVAHAYRNQLPFVLRKSWRRHHGLYKALGMTSFVFILLALYGGGQI